MKVTTKPIAYVAFVAMLTLPSCQNDSELKQEIAFSSGGNYSVNSGIVYIERGDSLIPLQVSYLEAEGQKVFQGDILLTTSEDFGILKIDTSSVSIKGLSTLGKLWPEGLVYYSIDTNLPQDKKEFVKKSIEHWESKTNLVFKEKSDEKNWVNFIPNEKGPLSYIGMKGGMQEIWISKGTGLGNIKHEIGHAVGLWHEHSRNDRDKYITVIEENIDPTRLTEFKVYDGNKYSDYDINSIMHYHAFAFPKDPANPKQTIKPKEPAPDMGQRNALSELDIKGINVMYP